HAPVVVALTVLLRRRHAPPHPPPHRRDTFCTDTASTGTEVAWSSPSTPGTSGSGTRVETVTTTVAPAAGQPEVRERHDTATSTAPRSMPYSATTPSSTSSPRSAAAAMSGAEAMARAACRAAASTPSDCSCTEPTAITRYSSGTSMITPTAMNSSELDPVSSRIERLPRCVGLHLQGRRDTDEPEHREHRPDADLDGLLSAPPCRGHRDVVCIGGADRTTDDLARPLFPLRGRRVGESRVVRPLHGGVMDDVAHVDRERQLQHREGERGEQGADEEELHRVRPAVVGHPRRRTHVRAPTPAGWPARRGR
ncbi:unnamed protein product, partial [Penicillium discolor]